MHKLEINTRREDIPLPRYATEMSAGLDLINAGDDLVIPPGLLAKLPTGIKMKVPEGHFAMLTPRSGKSFKSVGFSLANAPGIIDADYRDEVGILACNYGNGPVYISRGERVAQIVIVPYVKCEVVKVDELSPVESSRDGGFGSTGSHE